MLRISRKLLPIFLAGIYAVLGTTIAPPATAFTDSVTSACRTQAQKCAATLGYKTAVSSPFATSASSSAVTIGQSTAAATTTKTVAVGAKAANTTRILIGGGIVTSAAALAYLGQDDVTSLQALAIDKYCQAFPGNYLCGQYSVGWAKYIRNYADTVTGVSGLAYRNRENELRFHLLTTAGTRHNRTFNTSSSRAFTLDWRLVDGEPHAVLFKYVQGAGTEEAWENWPQSERDKATDLLTDQEVADKAKTITLTPPSDFRDDLAWYATHPEAHTDDQLNPKAPPLWMAPSNPNPSDQDGDGYPDSDPDLDPDGGTDPSTGDSPETAQEPQNLSGSGAATGAFPSSEDCATAACAAIESFSPWQFDRPPVYEYARTALATKFPFDMFGSLPAGSTSCPNFTFFGYTYQLCELNDFVEALSTPIVISFIIYAILVL